MIRYFIHVLRRACACWAICDLAVRLGFTLVVTPIQVFGLLMFAGLIQGEWMPDYKLYQHLESEAAVKEQTRFLCVGRLISVGIMYAVTRFAIWVAA